VPSAKYQRIAFDSASADPSSSTTVGMLRAGVQRAEQLGSVGAVDHVDFAALVLDPELGEQ
jgi:hypothetical protein